MDKDITFYTIEYDDETAGVEIEDLMAAFDKIHEGRDRPIGEQFDLQVDAMMTEVAAQFELKYYSPNMDDYIFYPMSMSDEEMMEAVGSINE